MPNMIKLNFLYLLIKCWSGLVVKALVSFYEVLGSIFDGCMFQCILYKCNSETYTSYRIHKHVHHLQMV
jgi:hypothetical protein